MRWSLDADLDQKADSTLRCSQAVPHPSTNRALRRLTSEVGRDPVHSTRYGRRQKLLIYLDQRLSSFHGVDIGAAAQVLVQDASQAGSTAR